MALGGLGIASFPAGATLPSFKKNRSYPPESDIKWTEFRTQHAVAQVSITVSVRPRFLIAKGPTTVLAMLECRRQDLNLHPLARTRT